jgi:hypothetical protein
MVGRLASLFARAMSWVVVLVLAVSQPAGATTDPTRELRAAARATEKARGFVAVSVGDPMRVVYQAPDRYRYVTDDGHGLTTTGIQIGLDHYQSDSRHPRLWTHTTLPTSDPGVAVLFTRLFDTLANATEVTRVGQTYRVRVQAQPPTSAVVTVAHGFLTSVRARITSDPQPRDSGWTFTKIGSAPAVQRPPARLIQDKAPAAG